MQRRAADGFLIIEVAIASAILLIGIIGIAALTSAVARTNSFTHDVSEALVLGQGVIESLRSQENPGRSAGSEDLPRFSCDWSTDSVAEGDSAEAVVDVGWITIDAAPHDIRMRTLIPNRSAF